MSTRYVSKKEYKRLERVYNNIENVLLENGGDITWYSEYINTSKERYRVQGITNPEHGGEIISICVIDDKGVVHDVSPKIDKFWEDEVDILNLISIQSRLQLKYSNAISKNLTTEGNFTLSTNNGSSILFYKGNVVRHCSSTEMQSFIDALLDVGADNEAAKDE